MITPFTAYEIRDLTISADLNYVQISRPSDIITLTPAEARALLHVLPALIEIAEGQA